MMDKEESSEVPGPPGPTTTTEQEDEDDWCVPCSDEETEDGSKKKVWEPEPKRIIELYEKLCKDKLIELEWKNPGRRPPECEQENAELEESSDQAEEEEKEEEVTEFDFDIIEPEPTITPRRTPATAKTPRTHRVARMDKILDDIFKQKMDSITKAEQKGSKSPRTGSPRSGPSSTAAAVAPAGETTPKRPSVAMEVDDDPFSGL